MADGGPGAPNDEPATENQEDADQEGPGEAHRPRQVFCFGALGLPSLCV